MTYAVAAWRDSRGVKGITIGTVTVSGWDNLVAEIELTEAEVTGFMAACAAALMRAQAMTEPAQEPLPGAYDSWPSDAKG